MKIQLERSGGFTAIPLQSSIDTDLLEPEESKNLIAMVESAGFFDLPDRIPPSNVGADRFSYKLTIADKARSHAIEFNEADVPESLSSLIQRVTLLARSAGKR
ncbi:MAG: hypothetical protein P4N41_13530 [Negativicutes bacterium]|nr:hypothetical protein [Negativicutes bacterium]